MRLSQLFGRTSKTEGAEYKIDSHRLLIQAGFIRESTAGRYYLLPLGLKVHDKIIATIRQHMNASGAQEILMPLLHPIELWQETNRTSTAGFELMKVKDRRKVEFALSGTAEEMAVDLIRKFNLSYKDLPLNIYQFSTKFRDELRARGGLLRVREFIMKDAYSFSSEEQFEHLYKLMQDVYTAIFNELELPTEIVLSDNGYIGGDYCHEFVVSSEVGESRYFTTKDNSYAAHEDVAKFIKYKTQKDETIQPLKEVEGKGMIGVEQLSKFLNIPVEKTTKTILFETNKDKLVAAAVSGIYDINEAKLKRILDVSELTLASPETVKLATGAEVGYAGFINLPKKVQVILDDSLRDRCNFECGANRTNYHLINVNFGRDYPQPEKFYDIAMAREGDLAPDSKQKLIEGRGIEVGNTFQLGYYYSQLMKGADFTNEKGKRQQYYMGCYGIGIGRTMAALVEKHHDSKGIIWPLNLAPAIVYIARLGETEDVIKVADALYEKLVEKGIEVLYDDRNLSPGEKFNDADLLGIPYRVVISNRTVQDHKLELKKRTDLEPFNVTQEQLVEMLATVK